MTPKDLIKNLHDIKPGLTFEEVFDNARYNQNDFVLHLKKWIKEECFPKTDNDKNCIIMFRCLNDYSGKWNNTKKFKQKIQNLAIDTAMYIIITDKNWNHIPKDDELCDCKKIK